MKKIIIPLALVLIIFPVAMVFYKVNFYNTPIVPQADYDSWNIRISANLEREIGVINKSYPFPTSSYNQTVEMVNLLNNAKDITTKETDSEITFDGTPAQTGDLFDADFRVYFPRGPNKAREKVWLSKKEREAYTTLSLSEETNKTIKDLSNSIGGDLEDNDYIKQVSYYMLEEIVHSKKRKGVDLDSALFVSSANAKELVFITDALVKMKGIPSRIIAGVDLSLKEYLDPFAKVAKKYSLLNQVYLDNTWYTIRFSKGKVVEGIPANFLMLTENYLKFEPGLEDSIPKFTIYIKPLTYKALKSSEFLDDTKGRNFFLTNYSLYKLPLNLQTFFYQVLVIPFGALILAFCRNIIGVKTFGNFMPILIGIYLVSSGLVFGMAILVCVVIIGLFERYILDRFQLLAVPRLSILLTLLVFFFVAVAFVNQKYGFVDTLYFNALPPVIMSVFIERFSIMLEEEGFKNSMVNLAGTLFITLVTYALYFFIGVRVMLFTHPELLITIIGFLILIGRYHGYRLSELFRFKDFLKES